jgi:hypothetical protein
VGAAGIGLGGVAVLGWKLWGFGLPASAVALDGSAAALTAAAGALSAAAGSNHAAASAAAGTGAAATAGGAGITMGATLLRGGPVGAAILGLDFMKRDSESGNGWRSWLRGKFGISDDHEPAPWQPGGAWSGSNGQPVQAELHGQADVKGELTVKVEPSSELLRIVDQAKKASLSGTVRANGPGSLGVSSLDAAAHPSGVGHN